LEMRSGGMLRLAVHFFLEAERVFEKRKAGIGFLPGGEEQIEILRGFGSVPLGEVDAREMVMRCQPVLLGFPSQWKLATSDEKFIPDSGLLEVARSFVSMSETFQGHGAPLGLVRERKQLNGVVCFAACELHFGFKSLKVAGMLRILCVCERAHLFQDIRGLCDASSACVLRAEPETGAHLCARDGQEGEREIQLAKLAGAIALTIGNNGQQVVLAQNTQGPFVILIREKSFLEAWFCGAIFAVVEIEPG